MVFQEEAMVNQQSIPVVFKNLNSYAENSLDLNSSNSLIPDLGVDNS